MIISGKKIQLDLVQELQKQSRAQKLVLDILYVGENSVIERYINSKKKLGETLGVEVRVHICSPFVTSKEVVQKILDVSLDSDGIIVQLPLPSTLDKEIILETLDPSLDVDLLTQGGYTQFLLRRTHRIPPVVRACLYVLSIHHIELEGKKICILGNGKLVGKPMADWCSIHGLTYTQMTKENFDLTELKNADVIISGMGAPHSITSDMVKDGVVVLDAGTTEEDGNILGDCHPDVSSKALIFTPVPGGIGPLTVVALFHNLVLPYES